jgi:hypothetical protein
VGVARYFCHSVIDAKMVAESASTVELVSGDQAYDGLSPGWEEHHIPPGTSDI